MNLEDISFFQRLFFILAYSCFPFFTITLFVVQDNLANKIQNATNIQTLRKSVVDRCFISSVVRAFEAVNFSNQAMRILEFRRVATDFEIWFN